MADVGTTVCPQTPKTPWAALAGPWCPTRRCPGPSTILGIGEALRERPLRRLSSKAQSGHFELFNARAYTLLGRKHRPVKLQDHYMWLEMNFEN